MSPRRSSRLNGAGKHGAAGSLSEPNNEEPKNKRRRKSNEKTASSASKHKSDDVAACLSPFKKLKIAERQPKVLLERATRARSTSEPRSVDGGGCESARFIEACRATASHRFYDQRAKLGLGRGRRRAPWCCRDDDACRRLRERPDDKYSSLSDKEEGVRIFIRTKRYLEAIMYARDIVEFDRYPTVESMMDFVDMLLHIKEDRFNKSSSGNLLQNVTLLFEKYRATHPPCHKIVRKNYEKFLRSPYCQRDFANSALYKTAEGGLFTFVLTRFQLELSNECDEPLRRSESDNFYEDDPSIVKMNEYIDAEQLHDYFTRKERVERLFNVLRVLVCILEDDLVIWMMKHNHSSSKIMMSQRKPLMASILWGSNSLQTGTFNDVCQNIIKAVITVHEQDDPVHKKLLQRLFCITFYMFNLCEENSNSFYPLCGKYSEFFVKSTFKILQGNSPALIVEIVRGITSELLQYLLSRHILKNLIQSQNQDFMNLILEVFERRSWTKFMMSTSAPSHKTSTPKFSLQDISHRIKKNISAIGKMEKNGEPIETPKRTNINEINVNEFSSIFYIALSSFFSSHGIEKIKEICSSNKKHANEPETHSNSISDLNAEIMKNKQPVDKETPYFILSVDCLKYYRSIFQNLKKVQLNFAVLKHTDITIYKLLSDIPVLQRTVLQT